LAFATSQSCEASLPFSAPLSNTAFAAGMGWNYDGTAWTYQVGNGAEANFLYHKSRRQALARRLLLSI
jgi:hypothetical protein